jgi:phenylalanyl-tRNA synthetase beta chain
MKISYNWLQTHIADTLPSTADLSHKITFHMCEVEGVEQVGDDSVIDVNVLPDRAPYALSHRGVAGEVAAIFNLKPKKLENVSLSSAQLDTAQIRIEDETLCTRYCARLIHNVAVSDSPEWLKKPLETVGQRSINTIVDVTNFVLFDIGQPLHAFDADKVKGTLVLRRAKAGEKITILDGREIALDETMLLEADDEGPLAIAGIKGGKRAEISAETKNIILVGGVFNSSSVRKTSLKIGIRSDASKRFENGLSIELQSEAVDHATKLILDLNKNASYGALADAYPHPVSPKIITANISDIVAVLGIEISESDIVSILERLNMKVTQEGDTLTISVPSNRLDIRDWRDIPEEVGRLYGYANIKASTPVISSAQSRVEKTFYYGEKMKNVLVEAGFSEVYTYSLVASGVWEIEKPLAADKNHLRTNLSDGLVKALDYNAKNAPLLGLDRIHIFEVGTVFSAEGEYTSLAIGAQQVKKVKGYSPEQEVNDVLKKVADALGVPVVSPTHSKKIPGGYVVEISMPALVATLLDPTSYDDLGFGKASSIVYKKFSLFPFIVRDIAVFVPDNTIDASEISDAGGPPSLWSVIMNGVQQAGGTELLVRYALFDTFKKDGKISFAFRLVFQAPDRTLTDEEANTIMESVYTEIRKVKGWEVR